MFSLGESDLQCSAVTFYVAVHEVCELQGNPSGPEKGTCGFGVWFPVWKMIYKWWTHSISMSFIHIYTFLYIDIYTYNICIYTYNIYIHIIYIYTYNIYIYTYNIYIYILEAGGG